jgi:hypothetical protein
MPFGILIIMKRKSYLFNSAEDLSSLIKQYFEFILGEYHLEPKSLEEHEKGEPLMADKKVYTRQPEPPTMSGLTYYLGFNSRKEFNEYEKLGKHAELLKRARLKIETEYEKKLHQPSAAAAIFALKSMGWSEKSGDDIATDSIPKTLSIKIIETGPQPAGSEKEVILN